MPATIIQDHYLELLLREPDFTSAARLASAINEKFTNSCQAVDATTVRVRVPDDTTVVTPRTETTVTEGKAAVIPLPDSPTVEKVANSLNALGVTPRDIMAIFQAMKQAG